MRHRTTACVGLGLLITAGTLLLALDNSTPGNAAEGSLDRSYQSLDWSDLKPPPSAAAIRTAVYLSDQIDQMTDREVRKAREIIEENGDTLVTDIDGKHVSIEGFLVPIDFDVERTSDFVLVPYYGACIHVPPPAPNQIVLVKFEEGLAMSDFASRLTTRFRVDGRIEASIRKTDIADVGYQLTASRVEKSDDP